MKRSAPVWPRFGMEEPKAGLPRQSLEVSKKTDASEELEVFIPRKEEHGKSTPGVHLIVDGEPARQPIISRGPDQSPNAILDVTVAPMCHQKIRSFSWSLFAGTTHAQADTGAQAPHTTLLQVFPKWLRVTSLWFKGKHELPCAPRQQMHKSQTGCISQTCFLMRMCHGVRLEGSSHLAHAEAHAYRAQPAVSLYFSARQES